MYGFFFSPILIHSFHSCSVVHRRPNACTHFRHSSYGKNLGLDFKNRFVFSSSNLNFSTLQYKSFNTAPPFDALSKSPSPKESYPPKSLLPSIVMSNLFKPHLELLSLGFRAVISFELRTMLNPEQSQVKLCTMPVDKYVAYSSIITRQTEDNMIRSIALILLRDSPLEYSTLAIQLLVLEHCSRFSHRRGGWVRTRIRLDNRTLPLCSFLDLRSRPVSSKGVLSNGMFFRQEVRQIRRDVFVRTHSKPNIHLSCGKFLPYD